MKPMVMILLGAGLAGCQSNISSDYYNATSVGSVNRAVRGVIISIRSVSVSDQSGVGTTSGAAAGAIGGANMSNNPAGAAVLAIAGAVALGVAGTAAEAAVTKQGAFEYVVDATNGALLTLVQGGPDRFIVGETVLVLYGSPSRLVKVPSNAQK